MPLQKESPWDREVPRSASGGGIRPKSCLTVSGRKVSCISWTRGPWRHTEPRSTARTSTNATASLSGTTPRRRSKRYYDTLHESVRKRFEGRSNFMIWRMTSEDFFLSEALLPSIPLDWIYIDGDHSYEGCLADLGGATTILKKDGLLLGDDFGNKPGVEKAVKEFCETTGRKYEIFATNQYQIS